MKKLIFTIIIVFFFSIISSSVFAVATVDDNKKAYNERWVCLDSKLSTEDKSVTAILPTNATAYQKYTHSATI